MHFQMHIAYFYIGIRIGNTQSVQFSLQLYTSDNNATIF